ncbi:MAG TPA: AMIN domain-containing protein, partial [Polyangiaceae bacterium]|nr:AMIN domain-containing protein [Polyangiaceae bacterium]
MRFRDRAFPAFALLVFVALVVTAGAARAAGQGRAVTTAAVETADEATVVRLGVTAKPTYTARLDRNGTRLVVDLADVVLGGAPAAITRGSGLVAGVLLQEFKQAKRTTTRVLVTLARPAEFAIDATDESLVITLRSGASPRPAPLRARATEAPAPASRVRIDDVRFRHEARLDAVVIELGGQVRHRTVPTRPGRTRLVLEGVELPAPLERVLDVAAYGGPVASVATYPSAARADEVVVDVEHVEEARAIVAREGGALVLSFATAAAQAWSDTGVGADGGPTRRARTVSVEDAVAGLPEVHGGFAPVAAV